MNRELEIKLDFLGEGNYKMVSFSDTEKTKENAEIAEQKEITVKKGDSLRLKWSPEVVSLHGLKKVDIELQITLRYIEL